MTPEDSERITNDGSIEQTSRVFSEYSKGNAKAPFENLPALQKEFQQQRRVCTYEIPLPKQQTQNIKILQTRAVPQMQEINS